MNTKIRQYNLKDVEQMLPIWNFVVGEANAFPQMEPLTLQKAADFFAEQSFTGVAENDGEIVGLYILHPNNIGRCGHIANASYAVKNGMRGQHIGEQLVRHSLLTGKELHFRILQFNAVVASNASAIHLYEKIGFQRIGMVPEGYFTSSGTYEDIILYQISLV